MKRRCNATEAQNSANWLWRGEPAPSRGDRHRGCTSALTRHRTFDREEAGGPAGGMLTQMAGARRRGWARNRGKFAAGRAPRRAPRPGDAPGPAAAPRARPAAPRSGLCSCQRMPEKNPQPPRRPCCCCCRREPRRCRPGSRRLSPGRRRRWDAGRPPRPAPPLPHQGVRARGAVGGAGAAVPSLLRPAASPQRGPALPPLPGGGDGGCSPVAENRRVGSRVGPGLPRPHAAGLLSPPAPVPYRLPERWSRSLRPWRHWRGWARFSTP